MRQPVHLSIGQEAAAVGVCAALGPNDLMVSSHRGHAHYLAKGGSLNALIAELYGKGTGCSKGYGGSMHLVDWACGFAGSTSIVGGTIPVGVGLAWAKKLRGELGCVAVCLGDAAVEEGVFHESMNFASLHKLNVVFVCEDNGFSCYTPINERQPRRPIVDIAKAHGMIGIATKSESPEVIRKQMCIAMGNAPSLLVITTERLYEHCGPNQEKPLTGWELKPDLEIEAEIRAAFEFAEASFEPDLVGMYAY